VSGGTYLSNSIRANVVGDPTSGISGGITQRINRYFNTAAFAVPPNFTLGSSAPRLDVLRNPGQNGINLVLAKSFAIKSSNWSFERWNTMSLIIQYSAVRM
jgi:hypothetical protein